MFVLLASSLGALLSRLHGTIVLPTVVLEIVLGILIGPEVLGLAEVNAYIDFLSNFGLALLFFFAGVEVIERKVPRRALERGTTGWILSLALGLTLGAVLQQAGLDVEWWLLGVALATTTLGALVPILSDAGLLPTPLGTAALGTGVAGEFWPIVVISVFLTGAYGAIGEVLLLLGFGALVRTRGRGSRSVPAHRACSVSSRRRCTRPARPRYGLSVLLLALLVFVAADAGFEFVLGAFAAGMIVGLALDSPEGAVVRMRLEGIGFGFLVPIYFVTTGMTFDLDSLLTASGLALAALFLGLLVVSRGAQRFRGPGSCRPDRRSRWGCSEPLGCR